MRKNVGINEVKKAVNELSSELNVTIICEKVKVRDGAIDYRFFATNFLPSTNKARLADVTMYTRLGKKAYPTQLERLLEELTNEIKINREFPTINIKANAEFLVKKYNYNKDEIAQFLITSHNEEKLSAHQWIAIYDLALGLIVEEKGGITWSDEVPTQEVEEEKGAEMRAQIEKQEVKVTKLNKLVEEVEKMSMEDLQDMDFAAIIEEITGRDFSEKFEELELQGIYNIDSEIINEYIAREAQEGGALRVYYFMGDITGATEYVEFDGYANLRTVYLSDKIKDVLDIINPLIGEIEDYIWDLEYELGE